MPAVTVEAPMTANRKTRLALNITETVCGERSWNLTRSAAEIRRDTMNRPPDAPKSQKVWFVGEEAWILAPKGQEPAALNRTTSDQPIPPGDMNLAPGFECFPMFRRSDDLPGSGASGTTVASGFYALVKTVQAGVSWALGHLTADAAALPQVTSETEDGDDNYPIDRVMSGKISYAPNAPFLLNWFIPEDFTGSDSFAIFYFGGPADVTPEDTHGGQFAVSLRGGGKARLYEYDPAQAVAANRWRKRMEWQYADPGGFKTKLQAMWVIPYGRNRTEFRSASASFPDVGGGILGALGIIGGLAATFPKKAITHRFFDLPAHTGHTHKDYATGRGNVRLDINRVLRVPFSIARLKYPAGTAIDGQAGVVVDAPFTIPWPLDAGTAITVTPDYYSPDGTPTALAAWLFDADTNLVLTAGAVANTWLSVLNQQRYYVKIALASADGIQTPVVWGYKVEVANSYQTNTRTPNTAASVTRVAIEGSGTDPSTEQADVAVRDLLNAVPELRQRDGIRSMIQCLNGTGSALVSNLFEGETMSPEGRKRGIAGVAYPNANWRDFPDVRMTGIWSRLACQFFVGLPKVFQNHSSDTLPVNGDPVPWKATSAIRHLLNEAGFNDADLDIPDLDIRLWPSSDGDSSIQTVNSGTDFATAVQRIAWDYLRMVLVRDVNCRTGQYEGKWRLIYNPVAPYTNILATFHLTNPGGLSGKMPHMLGSYTASHAPILEYRDWPVRPECNIVVVFGKEKDSGNLLWTQIRNQPSMDTEGDPDYLGYALPVYFPTDNSLTSQKAVDWAARTIYDSAAHAQKRCCFTAPLVFVTDATDTQQVRPRPLRINDLITVGGLSAIVRNVHIDIEHDWLQQQTIEALYLTDTIPIGAPDAVEVVRKATADLVAQQQDGTRATRTPPVFRGQMMNRQTMAHHQALPVGSTAHAPIQAADGSFYYMADYDPIDSAPLN